MIMATCLWDNITAYFPSLYLASYGTGISEKRIKWCIETGHKWKGYIFDEQEDSYD